MTKTGLALALLNPIALLALLVFAGVMFAVGYAILWTYGLVTATVMFIGGTVLLYLVGRVSPGTIAAYPTLLLIPVGLSAFGFVVDKVPMLNMFSLNRVAGLAGLGLLQDAARFLNMQVDCVFALALIGFAVLVVAAAWATTRRKRR